MKRPCGLDSQVLWEYQEGLLATAKREEVARHIESCADCRATVSTDQHVFGQLRGAKPAEVPDAPFRYPDRESARVPLWRWPVTVGAVALIGIVTFGLFTQFNHRPKLDPDRRELDTRGPVVQPPEVAGLGAKNETGSPSSTAIQRPAKRKNALQPKGASEQSLSYPPEATMTAKPAPSAEEKQKAAGDAKSDADSLRGGIASAGGFGGAGGRDGAASAPTVKSVVDGVTKDYVIAYRNQEAITGKVSLGVPAETTAASVQLKADYKKELPSDFLRKEVTQSFDKAAFAVVLDDLSRQTKVPIEMAEKPAGVYLTTHFYNLQLGYALANIAVATGVQWKDNAGEVLFFGREGAGLSRAVTPSAAARTGGNKKADKFNATCPTCGNPNLGPQWTYCPFCGKPINR